MDQNIAAQIKDYLPGMYRTALRILGNPDDAEDVVQDACIKSLRGWDSFANRCTRTTWLYRITVNCATDHLRRHHRREQEKNTVHPLTSISDACTITPDAILENHELFQRALEMVNKLPYNCKSAFVLTQLDGYGYDAAAAILKLPRGTVASRVHRAKAILLEKLGDLIDEDNQ